jgi:hypothetical protein
MARWRGKAESRGDPNSGGRFARGFATICVLIACGLSALGVARDRTQPQISVLVRRAVHLRGGQPQLVRASILPDGSLAVFSERVAGDFLSFGIFSASGDLVKNLAGTDVPTGLARLTSLQSDRSGALWTTTFIPSEVARFNQNGLISVSDLPRLKMAYALALDEPHGYVYVSGCVPEHPGADASFLLVHQFAIDGLKFRKSFLQTDPTVLGNRQLGIQWVPLDVDANGIVWAVDSPALTLYSIDPASGRYASIPIRSRVAKSSGRLDPFGGDSYVKKYIKSSFVPESVIANGDRVVVAIRQPAETNADRYLLEIFDTAGVQIVVDVPAPGSLVGKFGIKGFLFGRMEKDGPVLIEGVLSNSLHSQK